MPIFTLTNSAFKTKGGYFAMTRFPNEIWRKKKDIDVIDLRKYAAYVAGLMDGEGSFSIINRSKTLSFNPCIALTMTHQPTVARIADLFGVEPPIERVSGKKRHKNTYSIRVNTQVECLQICRALYGYSITKREPIRLLREFLMLWMSMPDRGPKPKEKMLKVVELHISSKKANRRGRPPNYDKMRERLMKLIEKKQKQGVIV
jgi:hypothetical protein